MSDKLRVRFAPSPTGYMHIGNLRTALYNYLFARHCNATFVLRIEDTDRKRHNEDAISVIINGLRELGMNFDEGPFFQSERLEIYQKYADKLMEMGLAYKSDQGKAEMGEATILRAPDFDISWVDAVKGRITFAAEDLRELVIIKSDGFPTYNFACVVDDHEMEITHVFRGDDHVSNTPKQIAIYAAFGWVPPTFGHFPMILGMDGQRLSKRHGAVKVTEFIEQGYLPQALLNFIALLGWSPGEDRELMNMQEMIEAFTIDRVRPTASRFDYDKFLWINSQYLKNSPAEDLVEPACEALKRKGLGDRLPDRKLLCDLIELYRERMRTMNEFADSIRYFLISDEEMLFVPRAIEKVMKKQGVADVLSKARESLSAIEVFDLVSIEATLRQLSADTGLGFGKIAQPIRVAVAGTDASAEIFPTLYLLGRDRVVSRIARAEQMLANFSFPLLEEQHA